MKMLFPVILLCAALAGCNDEFKQTQRESAKEIEGFIQGGGAMVVYSLDPVRPEAVPQDEFHGYEILGQTEVTDPADRSELLTKLAESIRQNKGEVAACFIPRHGLRFQTDDGEIDYVICFECHSALRYGTTTTNVLLTGRGAGAFNAYLDRHGIQRSTE